MFQKEHACKGQRCQPKWPEITEEGDDGREVTEVRRRRTLYESLGMRRGRGHPRVILIREETSCDLGFNRSTLDSMWRKDWSKKREGTEVRTCNHPGDRTAAGSCGDGEK